MCTKLFKFIKEVLTEPLTIINQTLQTRIFPDNLKIAKVIPLLKKEKDSILKLSTHVIPTCHIKGNWKKKCYQLYTFFQNLFYNSQYGFTKGHSTELAEIELIDKITREMDKGEIPMAIFLDCLKAFVILDHEIINQLSYYGVRRFASAI